jgi:hypothetical protein
MVEGLVLIRGIGFVVQGFGFKVYSLRFRFRVKRVEVQNS